MSESKLDCSKCSHRKWEEGDREHSPPGYGVYYCDLTETGALPEDIAKGKTFQRAEDCKLVTV